MDFCLNFRSVLAVIIIMESLLQVTTKGATKTLATNQKAGVLTTAVKSGKKISKTYIRLPRNRKEVLICRKRFLNVDHEKLTTFKTINFGEEGESYQARKTCILLVQGSRKCVPVIDCKTPLKLRNRIKGTCKEDYLLISDGLGGEKDYCGNEKLISTKPSNDGKELYIKFVTGLARPNPSYSGFKCTASCESANKTVHPATPLQTSKIKKKILPYCVCGVQKIQKRIFGGTTAKMFEFPWLAAIVLKGTRTPICGGSIINDEHILTAAHCLPGRLPAYDYEVLTHAHLLTSGKDNTRCMANVPLGQNCSIRGIGSDLPGLEDKDENTTRHQMRDIIIHPLYDKHPDAPDYDIAIIKLETKINLKDEAIPICLPKRSSQRNLYKEEKVTVAGWGYGHPLASANNALLQKLEDMPIIDPKRCREIMTNHTISDRMLCAGFLEGGKDSCEGDSGGPLWHTSEIGQNVQLGIVSWGDYCGSKNRPGVYTDVQEMMEWVNYNTRDQNVSWCMETKSKTPG